MIDSNYFFFAKQFLKTQMITIYTNEKQGQAIANPFRKAICFFLFILFGISFSQEVNLEKNKQNQSLEIDSSNSSLHTLGGAIVINNPQKLQQQIPVKSKKIKAYKSGNKIQFSKKTLLKKHYATISYQNFSNKNEAYYKSNLVNYYIAYVNSSNNSSKDKSIILTTNLLFLFLFVILFLKRNNYLIFIENTFLGSYHSSRPPPL